VGQRACRSRLWLRVGLNRLTDRSRARLLGIEVVEQMTEEIDRRKDPDFRKNFGVARTTLKQGASRL
jgi:hypothetical protein